MQKNRLLILFFIPFLIGIVLALFCHNMNLDVFSVMTEEACKNVVRMQCEYPRLFLRCLLKRMLPVILLPALIAGGAGIWIVMLFFIWFSLSMGAVMEILALQYGLLGILLFVVGIFPQYFFYLAAYVMLIRCCEGIKRNRTVRRYNNLSPEGKRQNRFQIPMMLGVVIMGSFFESYVNPFILKGFIKIFFGYFYYI